MKALLCVLLSLPGVASAWELVDPARPVEGIFAVVNITDVVLAGLTRYVGMAGDDPAAGCRQVLNRAPDASVDGILHRGRFVQLGRDGGESNFLIPIVLFARAHNVRVYVRMVAPNCSISEIRTCFDPASCQ